jgi:hypothetical protein
MKFIIIQPRARQKIPRSITRLGPYLSLAHPPVGAQMPCPTLWILDAIDATARLKPSSEAIGLNKTENPRLTNPVPKKPMMLVAKTIHQPKNIFEGFGISIKESFPQMPTRYSSYRS